MNKLVKGLVELTLLTEWF